MADHNFIKEVRPGTIERLKSIDWLNVCYPSLSSPRLHRYEICGAYVAKYGDPEHPDYDPDNPPATADARQPWQTEVAPEPVVAVKAPEPVAKQPPSATEPPAAKPVVPVEAIPEVAPKRGPGRPAKPKPEWFTVREVEEDGRLWWRVFDSFGPTKCDRQFTKHEAMKAGMRLKVPFREEGES